MTVRKPEMKFREFNRYRGYYCGLCRAIGKRCGSVSQLALSFEMTFLGMLLTSLYEPETSEGMHRCPLHPVGKRLMLGNEALDYCADLSALTAYYDLRDGWDDEKKPLHLVGSAALAGASRRAGERLPRQKQAVEKYVRKLHEIEQRNEQNLDAAANLTGEMLGELYVWKDDFYARDLRELGFYLGKFIYLCDCFEDIERDEKKHNYNPLLSRKGNPNFDTDCRAMLEDNAARAAMAFERLPLLMDAEIMRNILYSGIWLRFEGALDRRKAKDKT